MRLLNPRQPARQEGLACVIQCGKRRVTVAEGLVFLPTPPLGERCPQTPGGAGGGVEVRLRLHQSMAPHGGRGPAMRCPAQI